MNRRPIYLLGMGGFGPELLQLLHYTQGEVNWEYRGYFDDNTAEKSGIFGPYRGTIAEALQLPEGTALALSPFLPQTMMEKENALITLSLKIRVSKALAAFGSELMLHQVEMFLTYGWEKDLKMNYSMKSTRR